MHRLPLEEFLSPARLAALPASALRELLRAAPQPPAAPRPRAAAARAAAPPPPLEKSELVAALVAARGGGGSAGATCAVCLGAYTDGDVLRVLPCAHRFHVECIDGWLLRHSAACPFCAARVA